MEKEKPAVNGSQIDSEFNKQFIILNGDNSNSLGQPNNPLSEKSKSIINSFNKKYLELDSNEIQVKILIESKISNIYLRSIKRNLQFFFWLPIFSIISILLFFIIKWVIL